MCRALHFQVCLSVTDFRDLFMSFQMEGLLTTGCSGVPRNFFGGGGSTNSVEDREKGDLGAVAPSQGFWRQL